MLVFKRYVSPALLLILVTGPLWQASQSLPVTDEGRVTNSCVLHAHTLLQNITNTLSRKDLFSGINCEKQGVDLNMETETPSVCAPKGLTCAGVIMSQFNKESCLKNIREDLSYYYRFLAAQLDPDSFRSILCSLRELMEGCFAMPLPTDLSMDQASADRTYNDRLSLCKMFKGFQVRAITLNRVLAYMNSGEHTK
ncbi:interleukin-12 subunit alpha-like [Brachionichthys hirsutus]|uniref:interleukin-12 subunit alpha-like n=1 Tax=Brachionichthys hirsutus TaxID=412623 RepID=UPI003604E13D